MSMSLEIQLAGICFSPDDWSAFDEETRRDLIAVAARDDGDFDDEPTLIRAPARAGA
jgi:hypothetical protein